MNLRRVDDRTLFLCVVAKGDVPIFEAAVASSAKAKLTPAREDLLQLVVHMALDAVEQKMWATTGMVFKDVENFGENRVSAFVTAGHVKFMLVHDPKLDENAMKAFFAELYELYIKIALNPFYQKNTPIVSKAFGERVRQLMRRLL